MGRFWKRNHWNVLDAVGKGAACKGQQLPLQKLLMLAHEGQDVPGMSSAERQGLHWLHRRTSILRRLAGRQRPLHEAGAGWGVGRGSGRGAAAARRTSLSSSSSVAPVREYGESAGTRAKSTCASEANKKPRAGTLRNSYRFFAACTHVSLCIDVFVHMYTSSYTY